MTTEAKTVFKREFEPNAPKRVDSIRILWKLDETPDLSYLGEYSSKAEVVHIDRKARGDMSRGEYQYFNAGCGDPEYIEQDYKRAEAYNAGDWQMLGCVAEATVSSSAIRNGALPGLKHNGGNGARLGSSAMSLGTGSLPQPTNPLNTACHAWQALSGGNEAGPVADCVNRSGMKGKHEND